MGTAGFLVRISLRDDNGHYAQHPPWRKQPGFLVEISFGATVGVNLCVDLGIVLIRAESAAADVNENSRIRSGDFNQH